MKLSDELFITVPVNTVEKKASISDIKLALNPMSGAEALYDSLVASLDYVAQEDEDGGEGSPPREPQRIVVRPDMSKKPQEQVKPESTNVRAPAVFKPSQTTPGDVLVFKDMSGQFHRFYWGKDPKASQLNPGAPESAKLHLLHLVGPTKEALSESAAETIDPKLADQVARKLMLVEKTVGGDTKDFTDPTVRKVFDTGVSKTPMKVLPSGERVPYTQEEREQHKKNLEELDDKLPSIEKDFVGLDETKRAQVKASLERYAYHVHKQLQFALSELVTLQNKRQPGLSDKKLKELLAKLSKAHPSQRTEILNQMSTPGLKKMPEAFDKIERLTDILKALASKDTPTAEKVLLEKEKVETIKELDKIRESLNKSRELLSSGSAIRDVEALRNKVSQLGVKLSRIGGMWKRLVNLYAKEDRAKEIADSPILAIVGDEGKRELDKMLSDIDDLAKSETESAGKKGASRVAYDASPTGDYFKVKVTHDSGAPASPTELSALLKSLGSSGIVEQVDAKGAIFKIDLPEELEHKLIIDGKFKVVLDKFTIESVGTSYSSPPEQETIPPGATPESVDEKAAFAGTQQFPVGQRDSISKEEVQSTGKIGQQMPSPKPPAGPPPGAPGEAPNMPDVPDEPEDPRSVGEIAEQMRDDSEALLDKVQSGETMMGDKAVEPVMSDAGFVPQSGPPSTPQKVAVDDYAKSYYEELYGDYGVEMARDRVADIIDVVERVAAAHNLVFTDGQVSDFVRFLTASVSGDKFYNDAMVVAANNDSFATLADEILVTHIVKTGIANNKFAELNPSHKPSIFAMALNGDTFSKISKIVEAQKMKLPSVNKKHEDAVKVDEIGDNAEKQEHASHMCFEVEDSFVKGNYLHLEISWEEDEKRGSASVKNMLKSFVKGLESKKEFVDYGVLGQVNIVEFDGDACVATVMVKSSRPGVAPTKVDTKKD